MAALILGAVLMSASFTATAQSEAEISAARCTDLAKSMNDSFQRRLQSFTPGPVNPNYSVAGASSFGGAINGILSAFGAPATAKGFTDAIVGAAQSVIPQTGFFDRILNSITPSSNQSQPLQTPGFNPYQR